MTQKPDTVNLPETGAIIDFRYLLKKDQKRATEDATPRPCLIWNVQAIESLHIVAVLPILSGATGARVAISAAERAALGLDDISEVVFEEANVFLWTGPHIVPQADGSLVRSKRASKQLLNNIASAMTGRTCDIILRP
jgi:hypothetical protein